MDTKIAIAIVTNRLVKPKTVLSLIKMLAYTKHQTFPIVSTEHFTIAEGRNYCVFQALNNNCTHILFIDDDMTFPEDTIEQLLANNKPIVGVLSYSRMLPLKPTVQFEGGEVPEILPTEPFKCRQVGTGVALIDCDVFKKLVTPWFKFELSPTGKIINGEDGYFCDMAKEAGFEVWCDPRLPIGHIGDYTYGSI